MDDEPRSSMPRRSLLGGVATVVGAGAVGWLVPGSTRAAAEAEAAFPYAGSCPAPVKKLKMPSTRKLNVLLMGDQGSGSEIQYAVARAARRVSRRTPIHLAANLGDNIYEMGASGDCAAEFVSKFERPTAGITVPWLMVQGNHDNSLITGGDGGSMATGDHEVAYHHYSPRWYMPSRYYSVVMPRAARGRKRRPLAEFLIVDDNPVTSYIPQVSPKYAENGPYMRGQRAWLRRRLNAKRADQAIWTFVLSHHPYKNNGSHRSAGDYDGLPYKPASGVAWKQLIEQEILGKADFILSGHDHSMQWLNTGPSSRRTQQIVCGASGKTDNKGPVEKHPAFWQQFGKPGFMILKIRDAHVRIECYTVDLATGRHELAFTRSRKRRRSQ